MVAATTHAPTPNPRRQRLVLGVACGLWLIGFAGVAAAWNSDTVWTPATPIPASRTVTAATQTPRLVAVEATREVTVVVDPRRDRTATAMAVAYEATGAATTLTPPATRTPKPTRTPTATPTPFGGNRDTEAG